MTELSLAKANAIITSALSKAAELELKPLGVAVLDSGGHLVAFQRQDGASFLRPEMASGKAFGALALGMGSRRLDAFARDRPHLMAGVQDVSGGRIVPVPGGGGGAVGSAGETSDKDEGAAGAGIEAAGFSAEG